jgi:hypothetical protein
MADDADRADQERDSALTEARWRAEQQAKRAPALLFKGACHYCDEALAAPLLYCDEACLQDFRNEEEALKRLGRR